MRRILGIAIALASLASGLGADGDGEARKAFLIYSSDERAELAPCG
jgi:hypothetical protein